MNNFDKPKWVYLQCKFCGKTFPFAAAQYRYMIKQGKMQETCCRDCGVQYRKIKKQELVLKNE